MVDDPVNGIPKDRINKKRAVILAFSNSRTILRTKFSRETGVDNRNVGADEFNKFGSRGNLASNPGNQPFLNP